MLKIIEYISYKISRNCKFHLSNATLTALLHYPVLDVYMYMYVYIYIHINICHSRYCPSRRKRERIFSSWSRWWWCILLSLFQIGYDKHRRRFFFFHCDAFDRSLAVLLACRFLILMMPPCIYVFDTRARARAKSDVACVFPFYIYIFIYLYVFPRIIIYRWRWRQVNAKDRDHISFFFFSFSVGRRAYIGIACLPMCALNVN